jgi:hypothetical protein
MNKFLKTAAIAAVASFAVAGSANAAIVTGFLPGADAPLAGDTLLYDFTDGNLGILDPGAVNTVIQTGTNGSGAQNPFSVPGGNYLSVLGGGTATLTFDSLMRSISFNWGSLDTYNTLTIHWSGGNVIPNPADGNQTQPGTNGLFFASVGAGESISGLTFASSQNSFEIDDISGSAVPEPATWAMMLLGFGAIGWQMRRRRAPLLAQAA